MELFTKLEGVNAITKHPKGVTKQVELYVRGDRVYVKHSGGFVEVKYKDVNQRGAWVTTHPDVKLLEHDIPSGDVGVDDGPYGCLRYGRKP